MSTPAYTKRYMADCIMFALENQAADTSDFVQPSPGVQSVSIDGTFDLVKVADYVIETMKLDIK